MCDSKNQSPPSTADPVSSVDARTSTPVCSGSGAASVSIMYFQSGLEYSAHAIMSKCAAPQLFLHHTIKSLNCVHVSRVGSNCLTCSTMHDLRGTAATTGSGGSIDSGGIAGSIISDEGIICDGGRGGGGGGGSGTDAGICDNNMLNIGAL